MSTLTLSALNDGYEEVPSSLLVRGLVGPVTGGARSLPCHLVCSILQHPVQLTVASDFLPVDFTQPELRWGRAWGCLRRRRFNSGPLVASQTESISEVANQHFPTHLQLVGMPKAN